MGQNGVSGCTFLCLCLIRSLFMNQIAYAKQKYHKKVQCAQERIHTILQFLGSFNPVSPERLRSRVFPASGIPLASSPNEQCQNEGNPRVTSKYLPLLDLSSRLQRQDSRRNSSLLRAASDARGADAGSAISEGQADPTACSGTEEREQFTSSRLTASRT